jgi:hypothetical protein
MAVSEIVFQELVTQLASKSMADLDEPRMEPVINMENGQQEGVLLETSLERVAVFCHPKAELELADVAHVRRIMARVQARRALLYVPVETTIPNPVMLLATLSRIRVVRVAQA